MSFVTMRLPLVVAMLALAESASAAVPTSSTSTVPFDASEVVLTASVSGAPSEAAWSEEAELAPERAPARVGLPWSARATLEGRVELRSSLGFWAGPSPDGVEQSASFGLGRILWSHAMGFGVTERLQIGVPLYLGYRFGDVDGHQVVVHGGANGVGFGFSDADDGFVFGLAIGLGADVVLRIDAEQRFFVGAGVFSAGQWSSARQISFETWRGSVSVGYALTWDDFLTVTLGVAFGSNFVEKHRATNLFRRESDLAWSIGAVVDVAGRQFPLVRFHVSDVWSIDAYVAVVLEPGTPARHSYALGFTINW